MRGRGLGFLLQSFLPLGKAKKNFRFNVSAILALVVRPPPAGGA
jgi:hypothetical protein